MKTYIFESQLNSNTRVEIKAKNIDEAYEVLGVTVKNHNDFDQVEILNMIKYRMKSTGADGSTTYYETVSASSEKDAIDKLEAKGRQNVGVMWRV
jgi:hypothetical protein